MHSYVLQATHAFLGMLPLFFHQGILHYTLHLEFLFYSLKCYNAFFLCFVALILSMKCLTDFCGTLWLVPPWKCMITLHIPHGNIPSSQTWFGFLVWSFSCSDHAAKAGYNVIPHFCGHGIGSYFHGPPQIHHYGKIYQLFVGFSVVMITHFVAFYYMSRVVQKGPLA